MKFGLKYVLSTVALVALVSSQVMAVDFTVNSELIGRSYGETKQDASQDGIVDNGVYGDSAKSNSKGDFGVGRLRLSASAAVNKNINAVLNTSLESRYTLKEGTTGFNYEGGHIEVNEVYLTTSDLLGALTIPVNFSYKVGAEAGKRRLNFGLLNQDYFNDISSVYKPLIYNGANGNDGLLNDLATSGLFLNFGLGKSAGLQLGYSVVNADDSNIVYLPSDTTEAVYRTEREVNVVNARLSGDFGMVSVGGSAAFVNNDNGPAQQNNTLFGLDASVKPMSSLTLSAEYMSSKKETGKVSGVETPKDIERTGYYIAAKYDFSSSITFGARYGVVDNNPNQANAAVNQDLNVHLERSTGETQELVLNVTRQLGNGAALRLEYQQLTAEAGKTTGGVSLKDKTSSMYTAQLVFAIK